MASQAYTFLQGNFAPVDQEVTVTELRVEGSIPDSLQGRYVRTGPNPIGAAGANYHWFAGSGMLHGVRLDGGRALWYRNRWVRSPEVTAALGEPAVPLADGGIFPGLGNTNIVQHAGSLWALMETSLPYEISPELDTLRSWNFGGELPWGINAHPKFDPAKGEMHVLAYGFAEPYVLYHLIDASGQLVRTEPIAVGGPVMVHDMGLTESKVVVFDLPVLFNLELAMAGTPLPFAWDPTYTPRIGVMPRTGTGADTVWVELDDPCYVYHPLNAYDDGDQVVIDLVVHPRAFDDDEFHDPSQGTPTLHRWTVDLVAGRVNDEVIDDRGQEFPRGDERIASKRHRYGYSLANSSLEALGGIGANATTSLLKHDLEIGTTIERPFGPGLIGSEFVFVPAGESAGEDEGYLMGFAYDKVRDASDLLILDAHDFGGPPVASVHLPVRVPQGFHGNWIPDQLLS
ncbi:MAG: carotenoid oxygenase family protein [Acidimicrobiales bacterium]|nr:carotenoid oxygenase family protein [Acidimicrobiales bacterium]